VTVILGILSVTGYLLEASYLGGILKLLEFFWRVWKRSFPIVDARYNLPRDQQNDFWNYPWNPRYWRCWKERIFPALDYIGYLALITYAMKDKILEPFENCWRWCKPPLRIDEGPSSGEENLSDNDYP